MNGYISGCHLSSPNNANCVVYLQQGDVYGVYNAVSDEVVHIKNTQQTRRALHMCRA